MPTITPIKEAVQKAYSLDKETIKKVLKGAAIAGTGSFVLYLLNYLQAMEFSNPNVTALVAFAVPFSVNLVKEYISGE